MKKVRHVVIPAEAATRKDLHSMDFWVPAFAGIDRKGVRDGGVVLLHKAELVQRNL